MAPYGDSKPDPSKVDPNDVVLQQLQRVLTSPTFRRSTRIGRFLSFVVQETLEGHADRVKEYLIGLEVFDRKESFDPRSDPIVRVQAGRLRSKLRSYYRSSGRNDEVRIEFRKGTYVPLFRSRKVAQAAPTADSSHSPPDGNPQTIAVLPFRDLSPNGDQEYLCDGITEEIISVLTRVHGIRVASRTSSFAFKGKSQDIREIGRALNVNAIVEGSVRKQDDRLRITAELSDVKDGFEVWSVTHERASKDVFLIQDEISQCILTNLKAKLLGQQPAPLVKRYTNDPEVYELYLRGRYHWNRRTEESLLASIHCFEEAIARNPDYALAHAGLADAYAILANRGALASSEAMPRAKVAALRALEIDEELSEAHASLGLVKAVHEWEWVGAEEEFKRAIDLNPRYTPARHWYAINCLAPLGRLDEALVQMKIAEEVDPVSLIVKTVFGCLLCHRREYDEAMTKLLRTLELDSNFYLAHWHLGLSYAAKGMYQEALTSLERAESLSHGSPFVIGSLGQVHAWAGNREAAVQTLSALKDLSTRRYVCSTEMARIHAVLGETGFAYEWLEKAFEERAVSLTRLHLDPAFEELRSTSRFTTYLWNLGLEVGKSALSS